MKTAFSTFAFKGIVIGLITLVVLSLGVVPGMAQTKDFDWEKYYRDLYNQRQRKANLLGLISVNNETGSPGVNAMNGALLMPVTDFALPGRGISLALTRTYNSKIWKCGPKDSGAEPDTILMPYSWLGLGWQLHMGRAWKEQADPYIGTEEYWVFESSEGVKYQLRPESQFLAGPEGQSWKIYRTMDASAIRMREVGHTDMFMNFQTDTLFITTSDGTRYILDYMREENFWNLSTLKEIWFPSKIVDTDGNYLNIEYGYHGGGNNLVNIVYMTRIYDSCGREILFSKRDIILNGYDTSIVLDNVKVKNSTGQDIYYRYYYYDSPYRKVQTMPFTKDPNNSQYYDPIHMGRISPNVYEYPLLRKVVFPNGDSVSYDYNSYLELNRISTPQYGKIRYGHGDYKFSYYYQDGGRFDTLGVRCITAESTFTYFTDNDPNSVLYYLRRDRSQPTSPPFTNPDSVVVKDALGDETEYHYVYSPHTLIKGNNPYGLLTCPHSMYHSACY